MIDLITYGSMLLIVAPILIGAAFFGATWLRDEFYKEPFYDSDEE